MVKNYGQIFTGTRYSKKLIYGVEGSEFRFQIDCARAFGYEGPFSERLIEDLSDPVKRLLMIEAIEYANKNDDRIIKYLHDVFLEQISTLIDGVGTALINIQLKKGSKIKSLFEKRETKQKEKPKVWNTPFGSFETY